MFTGMFLMGMGITDSQAITNKSKLNNSYSFTQPNIKNSRPGLKPNLQHTGKVFVFFLFWGCMPHLDFQ